MSLCELFCLSFRYQILLNVNTNAAFLYFNSCSDCAVKVPSLQAQCSEYKALYLAASVERDKLLELTKLQQNR